MAGAQGRVRALAGAGEFRRAWKAADTPERAQRRAGAVRLGANDVNILITGAAGMIGRQLTERLASEGGPNGRPIGRLTLLGVVMPTTATRFTGKTDLGAADLSTPGASARATAHRPDTIFHLAGVVSGEAELDF